jgi:ABC-type dipeptide/oligopeptide/nickel transport system ATPase component
MLLDGIDLVAELNEARAARCALEHAWRLIPQGAMNSLNPVMRINTQIAEAIEAHEGRQPKEKLKSASSNC